MKTVFIQSSFPRSVSTLLVNALYGLIVSTQEHPVIFTDFRHNPYNAYSQVTIFKTHDTQLSEIASRFPTETYKMYYICSERGRQFEDRYRTYDNVAIFDYNDLNNISLETICGNLYDVVHFMEPTVELSISGCMERVQTMNDRYEIIKDWPFEYTDPFFNLHGSHRKRSSLRGRIKNEH
jgi:hypothetical protein